MVLFILRIQSDLFVADVWQHIPLLTQMVTITYSKYF